LPVLIPWQKVKFKMSLVVLKMFILLFRIVTIFLEEKQQMK
jgi:hypothetical protein